MRKKYDEELVPRGVSCQCPCHTDDTYNHAGRCCFKCSKCHINVVAHLYNDHFHTCRPSTRELALMPTTIINLIEEETQTTKGVPRRARVNRDYKFIPTKHKRR